MAKNKNQKMNRIIAIAIIGVLVLSSVISVVSLFIGM